MHDRWLALVLLPLCLSLGAGAAEVKAKSGGVKRLGEEVVNRVDRVIQKKTFELWGDPWSMQGIPLLFPTGEDGFNTGLKVSMQNVLRQDPHKMEFEAQILASDKGRYKHFLKFDYPHAFGGRFRLTARVSYDRDITIRYFGVGNDNPVDKGLIDSGAPDYQYVRSSPTFYLQLLRRFGKHVRFGPILGLRWMDVTFPTGSLLDKQRPIGVNGGSTHYLALALQYDELDFEPYPSRGSLHEIFLAVHDRFTGSNYSYLRGTYTYRRYLLLHRKLIFAHRTLFEALSGGVPFYELGSVGGLNPSLVLGGDKYFRGFESNAFIDKIRLVMGVELRWDPLFFLFAKQDITLGVVPFLDVGRVWPSIFPLNFGGWHASGGWGLRVIWDSRFVIRADLALSSEGVAFVFNLGNSF